MGRSIHSLEGFSPPLSLIDERFMDIPAETDLCFTNPHFKVLIFLEADHELFLEGHPPLSIKSGDLLVLPHKILQTYRAARKNLPSRIHALRLLLNLPSPSRKAAGRPRARAGKTLAGFLAQSLTGIHHQPHFITSRIQEQITRLREEIEARRPGYRFAAGNLAISLIIEGIRQINPPAGSQAKTSPRKSESTVERAKEYLAENLATPLTLDQIAWHVRLSREHLARLFRSTTGQTVFQHLSQLRLETAKSHLCNPNLMVGEVARRSGFTSMPLFCRTFKRFMKITPLDYRMQRMGEIRFSPSNYVTPRTGQRVIRKNLF